MSVKILDVNDNLIINSNELIKNLAALCDKFEMIKAISILPDFHLKNKMEVSSSVTFAVKDHICFSLSSPEQNCGMTLVLTPLSKDEMSAKHIETFFTDIRKRVPLPPRKSPHIDRQEVVKILRNGAQWTCDRYQIDPSILQSIENNGCVIDDDERDFPYKAVIPDELIDIASSIFCHVGDGNHFLEMQYVDKIIDIPLCDSLGITPGQITIMYHSGSGYFGSMLGRYYAHRTKNTLRGHLELFPKKAHFHLSHLSSDTSLTERIRSYLLWKHFVFLPADSAEAKRSILSFKASTNYAYANRLSVFNQIDHSLQKAIGLSSGELSIFWDYSHNSIYLEDYERAPVWMHRHNTCRILPRTSFPEDSLYSKTGQPLFIPGYNTTSSFVAVAGDNCGLSLNSVDHGAGKSIDNFIEKGISKQYPDRETMIYNYKKNKPLAKKQYTDEGISGVVDLLAKKEIVKPIARLRPLAALKG